MNDLTSSLLEEVTATAVEHKSTPGKARPIFDPGTHGACYSPLWLTFVEKICVGNNCTQRFTAVKKHYLRRRTNDCVIGRNDQRVTFRAQVGVSMFSCEQNRVVRNAGRYIPMDFQRITRGLAQAFSNEFGGLREDQSA